MKDWKYSRNVDRMLVALVATKRTCAGISAHLDIPEDDIIARLAFLKDNPIGSVAYEASFPPPAPPPLPTELPAIKSTTVEGMNGMDGLQILFLELCERYSELGRSIEVLSKLNSVHLPHSKVKECVSLYLNEHMNLPTSSKTQLEEFLAAKLFKQFILIPRPTVVISNSPPDAHPSEPSQS